MLATTASTGTAGCSRSSTAEAVDVTWPACADHVPGCCEGAQGVASYFAVEEVERLSQSFPRFALQERDLVDTANSSSSRSSIRRHYLDCSVHIKRADGHGDQVDLGVEHQVVVPNI